MKLDKYFSGESQAFFSSDDSYKKDIGKHSTNNSFKPNELKYSYHYFVKSNLPIFNSLAKTNRVVCVIIACIVCSFQDN